MRILHCMRAPVGGLFRHVVDLAGAQAERGHEVGILADSSTGDSVTDIRFQEIAPHLKLGIVRTPMSRQPGIGDLAAARFTHATASRLGVDILHGHGAKGGAYARLAGRALKASGRRVRVFYTPHGGALNYAPTSLQGRVFMRLERTLESMTDGLIFESAFAARIYAAQVGIPRRPQRVIPNGLQPADFLDHVPDPGAADFLFIGELRAIKGIDVLLEALKRVHERHPATLVLVGSGPETPAMKDLAARLGLSDATRFPGPMPARRAFPLGRTMVVPSRKESFPYVVLEAGAAGIPLISTNVGGIPEMVEGTDTPLIPPEDVEALTGAMIEALTRREVLLARARRLKAHMAERFTIGAMTDAILDFYSDRANA